MWYIFRDILQWNPLLKTAAAEFAGTTAESTGAVAESAVAAVDSTVFFSTLRKLVLGIRCFYAVYYYVTPDSGTATAESTVV